MLIENPGAKMPRDNLVFFRLMVRCEPMRTVTVQFIDYIDSHGIQTIMYSVERPEPNAMK